MTEKVGEAFVNRGYKSLKNTRPSKTQKTFS